MQPGLNQYSAIAAMPNAVASGGAPLTDEARALMLPVRITVALFLADPRAIEKQTFVTSRLQTGRGKIGN